MAIWYYRKKSKKTNQNPGRDDIISRFDPLPIPLNWQNFLKNGESCILPRHGGNKGILMSKNTVHILMLLSFFLLPGWADTWEDIRRNAGDVRSVSSDFVQEKHMKILKKPLISKGIFCFQAPDSLRWEYREPMQSIMLNHKGKTSRFVKGKDGFVQESARGVQAMQVVMEEISQWMKGEFTENPNFSATLESGPKILLRPKAEAFSKIIERIELVLSPDRPGIIDHVSIYESGNSYTKIIFQNVRINESFADALFQGI